MYNRKHTKVSSVHSIIHVAQATNLSPIIQAWSGQSRFDLLWLVLERQNRPP